MISLSHINTQSTRVFMGTLTNGEAIHDAFAKIARIQNIHAATFEMLGGLTEVEFTEYDFINKTRKPPLVFARPLEILSGHGTISRLNDEPHIHTHLMLSFRDESATNGIALLGGHAARAIAFAIEFTLTVYDGVPVNRAIHKGTGLQLWDFPAF
ncbi:MAG: DNA-binding protein [Anaerolineales bacterium]|nr:DNA-binding protein [Anaerolineales bacterium]WKZ40236.1 MAG: DNA-binding protein [Anaerolineales bacterium]